MVKFFHNPRQLLSLLTFSAAVFVLAEFSFAQDEDYQRERWTEICAVQSSNSTPSGSAISGELAGLSDYYRSGALHCLLRYAPQNRSSVSVSEAIQIIGGESAQEYRQLMLCKLEAFLPDVLNVASASQLLAGLDGRARSDAIACLAPRVETPISATELARLAGPLLSPAQSDWSHVQHQYSAVCRLNKKLQRPISHQDAQLLLGGASGKYRATLFRNCVSAYLNEPSNIEWGVATVSNEFPTAIGDTANSTEQARILTELEERLEFWRTMQAATDIYQIFDQIAKMAEFVEYASMLQNADDLDGILAGLTFLGSTLTPEQVARLRDHIQTQALGAAMGVLADFAIDRAYDQWERDGRIQGLRRREVAKSVAGTLINMATLNLPGEVISKAVAVSSAYIELKVDQLEYVDTSLAYSGFVLSQLNGSEPNFDEIVQNTLNANEAYVSEMVQLGFWGSIGFVISGGIETTSQIQILNDLIRVRAAQLSGKDYGATIESAKAKIAQMQDATIIGGGSYARFAADFAMQMGVEGW